MNSWQHLFLHEHSNLKNLFEMMQWCHQRHGDPIFLPKWIQDRLQSTQGVSSWDQTLGGWTSDWRDSGYSFYHPLPRFWGQIHQGIWGEKYLKDFPLCVLFYSQEDFVEFQLVWA